MAFSLKVEDVILKFSNIGTG
uniref:Uncharacterized protein n=1 Tax=Anguilla anguilla TaxID=7936 RepID=A0A0E9THK1_ANGAN